MVEGWTKLMSASAVFRLALLELGRLHILSAQNPGGHPVTAALGTPSAGDSSKIYSIYIDLRKLHKQTADRSGLLFNTRVHSLID